MVRYVLLSFLMLSGIVLRAQSRAVAVGSGGGFAGTVHVIEIRENGLVLKGKGLGNIVFTACARLRKRQARRILADARALLNAFPAYDRPGNIYRFVVLYENDGERRITWGDHNTEVPTGADALFDAVQSEVATLPFKPLPADHTFNRNNIP